MKDGFTVRFWGVRGSIACPGPATQRYGGNTSCIEMRCGDRLLIFDAGTGLRGLGDKLAREGSVNADLMFTHSHFDHLCGMPFFKPLFSKGNVLRIWAGHLLPELTIEKVIREMMAPPLFPAPVEAFEADMEFRDFTSGDTLDMGDGITIRTAPLNHPNDAAGFRVEYAGRSACYVTDTEHVEGQLDKNILELIRGSDVVIYDSTFTDESYPEFKGWGHSTWQEGVRLCEEADAKTLVIFHHDPNHDDGAMDRIAEQAETMRPGTVVAKEGMVLIP